MCWFGVGGCWKLGIEVFVLGVVIRLQGSMDVGRLKMSGLGMSEVFEGWRRGGWRLEGWEQEKVMRRVVWEKWFKVGLDVGDWLVLDLEVGGCWLGRLDWLGKRWVSRLEEMGG